ncbi:outer membrane protein assembly factor [Flavobacteriaceae bacterium S356]|uniref:Outer membrane protein assembly factor n=1 Tax=Asprobacillus argus TaxID=3076534 RepID=A0ABU3LAQ5_9FLAO|nr:outer membrane protein assembly factor [Flavobacteriaceae bacterium S356]
MKFKFLFFLTMLFVMTSVFSQEKKVYDVKIKGANKTKISFIKKILTTKNGRTLDSLVLDEDIVRLKRLPAISHAYYQVFYSHDELYNVFIYLEENKTVIPLVNFWTSTNQQFSYKLGLFDYNFLGRNIAFGGFYQNNGFDTYALNFGAPNLFSKRFGLAFNYQDWKSEEPLYFNNLSANYMYNNISYEVLGLYEVNFKNTLNFGLNFFSEKYKYLSGATDPSVPQNLDLDKILLKLVYMYDNLDYYYQYVDGFKSILYTQYVTSNNNFQDKFFIAWNDFFYYKRVGDRGNWANRLRMGLSSNQETPFAPFALDNNVNLRGVGILVDRGTGSVVLNSEYRYTLIEKNWFVLQGNAFIDAGTWRTPGGKLNDFFQSENIRIFSGVGLRFIHKKIYNAIFRIDYGYGITRNESKGIVFGIGQYF